MNYRFTSICLLSGDTNWLDFLVFFPSQGGGGNGANLPPPPNPMVYCRCIFADVSLNLNVRQARSAPQRAKRSSHPETQCSGWAESR